MPYLLVKTNVKLSADQSKDLQEKGVSLLETHLGKPSRYIMTAVESAQEMTFAASPAPLAYVALKSIGLPSDRTAGLSGALCDLLEPLGIPRDRVYIEFTRAEGKMWGWNGGTF